MIDIHKNLIRYWIEHELRYVHKYVNNKTEFLANRSDPIHIDKNLDKKN